MSHADPKNRLIADKIDPIKTYHQKDLRIIFSSILCREDEMHEHKVASLISWMERLQSFSFV